MTEYRIDYSITRRRDGEEDFAEIGFGSSGAWSSPAQAAAMVEADLSHGIWETSDGMPDSEAVRREIEGLDEL